MNRLVILLATPFFSLGPAAFAQEAQSLLQQHLEARGGQERILQVKTLRAKGTMYRFGLQYEAELLYRSPNQGHLRYWGQNEHFQGVPGAFEARMMVDGSEAGLTITPHGEPSRDGRLFPFVGYPLRGAVDFRGPLLDPNAAEHNWSLEGREEIEGVPVWRLTLARAAGAGQEVWWLRVDTLDLIQRRFLFERWGRQVWATVSYADFVEVDGLRLPKTHLIDSVSSTVEWSFDVIDIDVPLGKVDFAVSLPATP
ncbi:MAG: hypothetical protein AAF657_05425 [Acidobacteriota bacterium]